MLHVRPGKGRSQHAALGASKTPKPNDVSFCNGLVRALSHLLPWQMMSCDTDSAPVSAAARYHGQPLSDVAQLIMRKADTGVCDLAALHHMMRWSSTPGEARTTLQVRVLGGGDGARFRA